MVLRVSEGSVADYRFKMAAINGILREILGGSASLLENAPSYRSSNEGYIYIGETPVPSHLLVFADNEGPKSISLFTLGSTDTSGNLKLPYRDIDAVERWFRMQKEASGVDIADTGVWYLVPPPPSGFPELGGFLSHSFVLGAKLEECSAIGGYDPLGVLSISLDSAVGFDFLNKESVGRAGWLNHTFVEPPPSRKVDPEVFHFPELAVIDRSSDDQFVF